MAGQYYYNLATGETTTSAPTIGSDNSGSTFTTAGAGVSGVQGWAAKFTVPAGQQWKITNVAFSGGTTTGAPPSQPPSGIFHNWFNSSGVPFAPYPAFGTLNNYPLTAAGGVPGYWVTSPSFSSILDDYAFAGGLTGADYYIGVRKKYAESSFSIDSGTDIVTNRLYRIVSDDSIDTTGTNTLWDSRISSTESGGGLVGYINYNIEYLLPYFSSASATSSADKTTFTFTVSSFTERVDLYSSGGSLLASDIYSGYQYTAGFNVPATTYVLRAVNGTAITNQNVTAPATGVTPGFTTTPIINSHTVTTSSVTLNYTAATSNGGYAIDGNYFEYALYDSNTLTWGSWVSVTKDAATPITISGLTSRRKYKFRFRTRDVNGVYSSYSAEYQVDTVGGRYFEYIGGSWTPATLYYFDNTLSQKEAAGVYYYNGTSWVIAPY